MGAPDPLPPPMDLLLLYKEIEAMWYSHNEKSASSQRVALCVYWRLSSMLYQLLQNLVKDGQNIRTIIRKG